MNRLSHKQRVQAVNCLVEGCSIRATVRMTGIAKKTVMRLLCEVGQVCQSYQDCVFRNLSCQHIQVDELWGFNYCKQKNVTEEIEEKIPGAGDVWLWVAIDADTKLVPCWQLGDRGARTAYAFVHDLAARLRNRVQLTSDGHRVYVNAIESAFGSTSITRCSLRFMEAIPVRHLLQPSGVYRNATCGYHGTARPEAHLYQFRREAQLVGANCDATLHSAVEWVLAKDTEPCSSSCVELLCL